MRERQFVKGSSSDEKFASIETTLRHFSHRLGKKIVGLLPATPVIRFVYVPDTDGLILNMICPANGRITQGCIYIDGSKPRATLRFQLERKGRQDIDTHEMKTHVPWPFRFDMMVELGDMISLWVDGPEDIKSVWIGFLYEISPEGLGKRNFVLSQIERMEEEDALPPQERQPG